MAKVKRGVVCRSLPAAADKGAELEGTSGPDMKKPSLSKIFSCNLFGDTLPIALYLNGLGDLTSPLTISPIQNCIILV
jgi:hypothetical protein